MIYKKYKNYQFYINYIFYINYKLFLLYSILYCTSAQIILRNINSINLIVINEN